MQRAKAIITAARDYAGRKNFSVRRTVSVVQHPTINAKTIKLIIELRRNRPLGTRRNAAEASPDAVVFDSHVVNPETLPSWARKALKNKPLDSDVSHWLSRLGLNVRRVK